MIGQDVQEGLAVETPEHRFSLRLGSCGTRRGIEETHFSEKATTTESGENDIHCALYVFADHDFARLDEIKRVGIIQLAKNDCPGGCFLHDKQGAES